MSWPAKRFGDRQFVYKIMAVPATRVICEMALAALP
jgi:hypothetical protein